MPLPQPRFPVHPRPSRPCLGSPPKPGQREPRSPPLAGTGSGGVRTSSLPALSAAFPSSRSETAFSMASRTRGWGARPLRLPLGCWRAPENFRAYFHKRQSSSCAEGELCRRAERAVPKLPEDLSRRAGHSSRHGRPCCCRRWRPPARRGGREAAHRHRKQRQGEPPPAAAAFAAAEVHLRVPPVTLVRPPLPPLTRAVQAQEVQAGMPPLVPHRPPG